MPLKIRLIRLLGFYLNYLFIPTIFVAIIVCHLLTDENGKIYQATVLSGKRELVYVADRIRIMIGPDNIYYYNHKGKYTNAEARGAIIFDKGNLAIIYEDGAYYAGFKLEEQ